MDLKELIAFQTILKEGTFSKAAMKLNYAQSTITNQIQRLEKELGIQLFKRGWEAELTEPGRIFAAEIDKLIRHWNYVADQAKALQKEEIGTLNIGAIDSLAEHVLPESLSQFREQKPLVACNIVFGNTDFLSRALLDGQLEFAICGEPSEPSAFLFEPLFREKIIFIAAKSHPLAGRDGISFEELLGYPLVAGGQTCIYYLRLTRQFSRYTQNPFLYTVNHIPAIPGFIRQLGLVGAVLESTSLPGGVVKLNIETDDPFIPVGLLGLRNSEFASSSRNLLAQLIKKEIGMQAFRD